MTPTSNEAACRRLTPAAAALALAGSAVAARRGVHSWETSVFRLINRMPDSIAHAMWVPMQTGALGAPLALAGLQALRGQRAKAARTAVTGFAAWAIAKGAKRVIARERPSTVIEETRRRVGAADHGLGYPSGHAAVAITVACGIAAGADPRIGAAGAGLAGIVGVTRIYSGAHLPLDVIGGWALGRSTVAAYRAIENRWVRA
jgi:membrane-associated phospholipid phosphatase